ncbi:MAG: 2-oxoacid:ferredoxin oxidoreductase subunit beta [Candidatus Kapabacteria bacterium]|nr:2-oxoacid:ferredoxin oxidoreductase subunit beta [Candidatus Kapabacteria bacterium]
MEYILDSIANAPGELQGELNAKDFKADIDVRWCAGCGDYAILASLQKVLPTLGIAKEKICVVSGIGCSSRFPYYMSTYGFHSIHGRALAIASGLKFARPDLSIWVPTGDGDCMSIGGNHFIHACRRNVDLNVIMFNNQIYSLTKGQYSPTSQPGQITKSSPFGVVDNPFNPAALALGAGATFVARAIANDIKHLSQMIEKAAMHRGISYIEVYTNCVIFNDGVFNSMSDKKTQKDCIIKLENGKPLTFGENNDKGLKLDGFTPVVFDINSGNNSINDAIVHNENDSTLAYILANMTYNPELPRPFGIFQDIQKPIYDVEANAQIARIQAEAGGIEDINALLRGSDNWEI